MHDRNGTPIKKGDTVTIEGVISDMYATEEYCNVTLRIGYDKPHGPLNVQSSVTLNARQVLLVKRAD
jgi:hypothetical protein